MLQRPIPFLLRAEVLLLTIWPRKDVARRRVADRADLQVHPLEDRIEKTLGIAWGLFLGGGNCDYSDSLSIGLEYSK
jgi:hypothetical protein